jgi:DNA-binding transcriptional ArsR family regulator
MAKYDDPRILRAIAHPTRNRILSELWASGSLRAADVARILDMPANQASFHLRQLAKYGLVEEAPEEARDKRDRVWRLADDEGISFRSQDMLAQPGGEAAMEVYRRNARAWGHLLVDRSLERDEPGAEKYINQGSLRFTQEEVAEFAAEFVELQNRWRERTRGQDDGRTTYSVYQLVQPYPDTAEETVDPVQEEFRVIGFRNLESD